MARQAIYTGNSGFDLPSHQLLSNPSQYRNTTWKLCRSPLLERRNPPIERHPPFSPEFIRHLPYPDDKLLANPVTHHHLPIYFFPYLSFPLLPPPEIESPVWKIIRNNQTPGMEFYDDKKFITENHIAYDELERLLNREKSLHHLSSESYKRLYEALIQQKANSSGRLIYRLTNFDGNFSIRFQRMFPECNTDELLLASMIHHQWRMTDMTTIFHASPEALRKRKNRLALKSRRNFKKKSIWMSFWKIYKLDFLTDKKIKIG